MLGWALTFLVVAIIAAVFGFGGIAAASASIAKIIFFIFLVSLGLQSLFRGWLLFCFISFRSIGGRLGCSCRFGFVNFGLRIDIFLDNNIFCSIFDHRGNGGIDSKSLCRLLLFRGGFRLWLRLFPRC